MYYGDTTVLVTATASKKPREGIDFFPLTCDYEERLYAVGRIPGGFIRREGRPTEAAILAARMMDRPIRPLFPKGFRNDVHVVATVMSVDQNNPPNITAINGASIALSISDIPFDGPLGAVIVGMVDDEFVINPDIEQSARSKMHLVVAGTRDAVMMVEAQAQEVPEEVMLDAILFGHEEIKRLVEFQEKIVAAINPIKKEVIVPELDPEIEAAVREYGTDKLEEAVRWADKLEREARTDQVMDETIEHFSELYPEQEKEIAGLLDKILQEIVRRLMLEERVRVDGRKLDEIRPISCEVGILPRTHGSGLFTRGQTQVLSVTTLGTVSDEQILDGLGIEESKCYLHHYNFPSYSVGETRPIRGPGRREIGHGALAEKALESVLPAEEEFPYTIRVVSEVLESNGSTSMGSVCGSTLSLMHAGVPIKAPVAGIAMGLVKEGDNFAILSDIQGLEDALGDMDFKVAGTAEGVTALQMDIKIAGVSRDILSAALKQAREGRMYIMGKMLEAIDQPSPELSPHAPRLIKMNIHPDKIRDVIGPGGKIIKKIVDETDARIDIEDDGSLFIAAADQESADKARNLVECLTRDVVVGKTYMGKVMRIMDFGAFVQIIPGVLGLPGKEGLVHISQLAEHRVAKVRDVVDVGDEILVKVTEIDSHGRINLSRKAVLRQTKRNRQSTPKTEGAEGERSK
jgi:polyribonucleotide nucleotidyltransferase